MSGCKDGDDDVPNTTENEKPDPEVFHENSTTEKHDGEIGTRSGDDACDKVGCDSGQTQSDNTVTSFTESCDKIPTEINITPINQSSIVNSEPFTRGEATVISPQSLMPEGSDERFKTTESDDLTKLKPAPEDCNLSTKHTSVVAQEKDSNTDVDNPGTKNNFSTKKPSLLSSSPARQKSERKFLSELSPLMAADILNEPFGDNETTLLHVCARFGHPALVSLLLDAGADPSVRWVILTQGCLLLVFYII